MRRIKPYTRRWLLLLAGVCMALAASAQIPYARWMIQGTVGPDSRGQWVPSGALMVSGYNDWGARAEWRDWRYDAIHTPADYEPGLCVWGDCAPRDHAMTSSIMMTRRWVLMPFWLECGIDLGPTLLMRKELHFTPNEARGIFESNYLQFSHSAFSAGGALRTHLDWYPSRYWGCSLGINTLFERTTRLAFDFAMQFGFTRFKGRR